MKALVLGAGGQVGRELLRTRPADADVVALERAALDICDGDAIERALARVKPDVVFNAAAYTQVDKAESEPDLAYAVNATGPGLLAKAASAARVRLVHVSTDFVFGGDRAVPWAPTDPTGPIGVYARSKLAGEVAVAAEAGDRAIVVRTAWVHSACGRNFVRTMLNLLATRDEVRVVSDQVGSPTWARELAEVLWSFAQHPNATGIYHWTDAGVASWYDFAVAIQEEALARGLLDHEIYVRPIASAEYPTPARRPAYSVLDVRSSVALLGREPRHWRRNLRSMLGEIAAA